MYMPYPEGKLIISAILQHKSAMSLGALTHCADLADSSMYVRLFSGTPRTKNTA
jgi:hypothetical protein